MFLILTAGSLLLGGMAFGSDVAAIALLSVSNTFCYFVLLMLNFKIAGAKFKNVWINIKIMFKKIK
jgi:hypothetical protein